KNGNFISFNKPVSATSTWTDKNNQFAANALNDGKFDTRWASSDLMASVEMDLNANEAFNKISIFEYQDTKYSKDGFSQVRIPRIQKYSVAIMKDGKWQTIFVSDQPMGDCKVIRFPVRYKTSKLRFNVIQASAPPSIYELSVINMPAKN
ncbi:MAG: discoidin domain-containing protein, partial [Acinetobacter sp.]